MDRLQLHIREYALVYLDKLDHEPELARAYLQRTMDRIPASWVDPLMAQIAIYQNDELTTEEK